MRVGLVCPYSFAVAGGVQNQVLGLARWLKSSGCDVGVLAPGARATGLATRYGLAPTEIADAGTAVPLPYNGSVSRVNMGLAPWLVVCRWLARGHFDVLHVHEPATPSVALPGVWAARRTGVPVVATCHAAADGAGPVDWLAGRVPGLSGMAGLTAVSAIAADTARRRLRREPVVIGNAIDVAALAPPASESAGGHGRWRGGDHPRLCFVGRFDEPRKGFATLLNAWPAIRRAYPTAELVVVGPGRPRPAGGVRYVGPIGDADRDGILRSCDVFVAPHLGRESFGIVLLEALAAGATVVASAIPAFVDVLSSSGALTGPLVPPGDVDALADGVVAALRDPVPVAAHAPAVVRCHDWSAIGPAYRRQYEAVVVKAAPESSREALPARCDD
jgi:phosphatidylinositol alpha-mannosyltransferase